MFKFQPGQQFAEKYTLVEKVGIGGFAEVWKVKRTATGFVQAIKIFSTLDDAGALLAANEFERVFNLNHPRLLKASDYGVFEGHPYLVMPFCAQGNGLKQAGKLDEPKLVKAFLDISSALSFLHGLDNFILHQDIKPDNFMIDDQGNYLLADFGISKKLKRSLTKSMVNNRKTEEISDSKNSGTTPPAYRPPETFDSDFEKRQPIKASDIWSLGASIFELATEELPFGDFGGLIQKQGTPIPNLPKERFSYSFNELIKWCLQTNPWDRPTAQQLQEAVVKLHQSGTFTIPIKSTPQPSPATINHPVRKKSKSLGLVIGLVSVLALSGFGMFYFKDTFLNTKELSTIEKKINTTKTPTTLPASKPSTEPPKQKLEAPTKKIKKDITKTVSIPVTTSKGKTTKKAHAKKETLSKKASASSYTQENKKLTQVKEKTVIPYGTPISIQQNHSSAIESKMELNGKKICEDLADKVEEALEEGNFQLTEGLLKNPARAQHPYCQDRLNQLEQELKDLQEAFTACENLKQEVEIAIKNKDLEEAQNLLDKQQPFNTQISACQTKLEHLRSKLSTLKEARLKEEADRKKTIAEANKRKSDIQFYLNKGDIAFQERNCKGAVKYYQSALELAPNDRKINDKIITAETKCKKTAPPPKPVTLPPPTQPKALPKIFEYPAYLKESIEVNRSGAIESKKREEGQYKIIINESSGTIDVDGSDTKLVFTIMKIRTTNDISKKYEAVDRKDKIVEIEWSRGGYFTVLGTNKKKKAIGFRLKL